MLFSSPHLTHPHNFDIRSHHPHSSLSTSPLTRPFLFTSLLHSHLPLIIINPHHRKDPSSSSQSKSPIPHFHTQNQISQPHHLSLIKIIKCIRFSFRQDSLPRLEAPHDSRKHIILLIIHCKI
ncbi:hypothetical protein Droror1_Dr00004077 [Drosera rotundifolia]